MLGNPQGKGIKYVIKMQSAWLQKSIQWLMECYYYDAIIMTQMLSLYLTRKSQT